MIGAMPLSTRLTERLGLVHPVVLAPMAFAAGGRLAAAVSEARGLGLIGGGYGDRGWIDAQFDDAEQADVGCGFITWSLERTPELLDHVLDRQPRAIMLSFGDPRPFAPRVHEAGVPLLCQVQSRADAELALEVGADVIVAQGAEAGGHGDRRATFTLVPEIADLLAARSAQTLLCAAGGIADGRGLAAALVLGADGVLVGSRLGQRRGERPGGHARRGAGRRRRRHHPHQRDGHRSRARLARALHRPRPAQPLHGRLARPRGGAAPRRGRGLDRRRPRPLEHLRRGSRRA